jgi:hypothetical protein
VPVHSDASLARTVDTLRYPCTGDWPIVPSVRRGLSLAWSQVVVALAPVVTIVGYETIGYRHVGDHVSKLRA